VGSELRGLVSDRAGRLCEYCRLHETDSAFRHKVDHLISRQHGGLTEEGNLAFACLFCNRCKGTNVASVDSEGATVRWFNLRRQDWKAHFRLEGAVIQPLTPEGVGHGPAFEVQYSGEGCGAASAAGTWWLSSVVRRARVGCSLKAGSYVLYEGEEGTPNRSAAYQAGPQKTV
jgi:hypothetical protein